MINNNSINALKGLLHHLILPLGGISLGLFIQSMYSLTSSPVFWVFLVTLILYPSLFISSYIISCCTGLKLNEVLRRDIYAFLPLLFFLFFLVKYSFSSSTPYYDYLAERYFSGILIISIGCMMIFLKIVLFMDQFRLPYTLNVLQKNRVYYLLSTLAVVYAGVLSYYSITRHNNLNSGIDCLGFYSQAVWLFSNLKVPFSSFYNKIIFLDHMTPILVLLVPFYKIYGSPITLLILQSVLLSSGIFPLYSLAKDKLDSDLLAVSLCIGYLLYPALQFANLYEFHPVNIATPLLLFIFYFFNRGSYIRYYIFLILALLCREDVVPIVFFLGIYILLYERKWKVGLATTLLSVSWFYFAYWIFLPYITSGEHSKLSSGSFGLYSYLGDSMGEIISTILLHPLLILKEILVLEKLGYIVLLTLPLCFISFFHPPTFLIGFSMIIGNMLSQNIFMSTIRFFYTATITPFIFISSIYALQFLLSKQDYIAWFVRKIGPTSTLSRLGLVCAFSSVILFSSVSGSILYGPLPYSSDPYSDEFLVKKECADVAREMFKLVPPNASVSAANNLGAHFCNRENVFVFPFDYAMPVEGPEYVVVNMAKPYCGTRMQRERFNEKLKELLIQDNYGVYYSKEGYTILKSDYQEESDIKKIALTTDKPTRILDIKLNNDITFWGYTLNTMTVRPKIPFRIVYFWKVSKETERDYNILIKFVDENGRTVFQQDHEPVYSLYPTSDWKEQEKIHEIYWVELPITVRSGVYELHVGIEEKAGDNRDKLENLTKVGTITVHKF